MSHASDTYGSSTHRQVLHDIRNQYNDLMTYAYLIVADMEAGGLSVTIGETWRKYVDDAGTHYHVTLAMSFTSAEQRILTLVAHYEELEQIVRHVLAEAVTHGVAQPILEQGYALLTMALANYHQHVDALISTVSHQSSRS